MTVLICGAGIGGLCLGLSLQQLKIPFQIFEASESIKPLGVGINLQPNAVRELYALGIKDGLSGIGIQTEEFGLFSKRLRNLDGAAWAKSRLQCRNFQYTEVNSKNYFMTSSWTNEKKYCELRHESHWL